MSPGMGSTAGNHFDMVGARVPYAMVTPAFRVRLYVPFAIAALRLRHALFPGYPTAMVTLEYPIACAGVLLLTGLIMDRWVERWISA